MVMKKDRLNIIEYVVKNYDWKNHESDFTPFTHRIFTLKLVKKNVLKAIFKANPSIEFKNVNRIKKGGIEWD